MPRKLTRLLTILAALLAFGVVAVASASASTVEDCQNDLATLRADTVSAETAFANPRTFDNAVDKLDEAAAKLAEGKNADARLKLVDCIDSIGSA